MADIDLPDDQRAILHKYMIDFVIQKLNILDCYHLETWVVFRRIFTMFPFPPEKFQLEFFCTLLPNLENYTIPEYYVDYFNKIRYMSAKERRPLLEENTDSMASLKHFTPQGREIDSSDSPVQGPSGMNLKKKTLLDYGNSVERASDIRNYDVDFMKDANIFFAGMPAFMSPCPVEKLFELFEPCWEIKTLLKMYPQQFVSNFLWWRQRKRNREPKPATPKRKLPPGSRRPPAKRQK